MRKSFLIHYDSLDVLDDLTDEQCGQLLRAMKAHHLGQEIEISTIAKIAFSPFKSQFARDDAKYQKVVDRNKQNGALGGRPKKPSGLIGNPSKPRKADSVSVSVSVSDSDSKDINPFDAFWSAYPKKVSKAEAKKAWTKIKPELVDLILSKVELFKTSQEWTKDNGQYIPNASTWLNQKRWDDELNYGAQNNAENRFGRPTKQTANQKANSDAERLRAAIAASRENESLLGMDDKTIQAQVVEFRG